MAILRPAGDFDRTYQQDMALLRRPWHYGLVIVALLAAYTIPQWGSAYVISTANRIAYTIIAVQGLNLLTGYTGQISLGQAAFMLLGGYFSALLVIHAGLSFFVALPVAALGTGLAGLLFGLPSLRVKGFYLAMATLAAQFIIPWLTRHTFTDYLGGTSGRIDVPVPQIGGFLFNEVSSYLYISLTVLLITTVLLFNISRTRLGRALISVRDNDLAAELLGVNLFTYKLRAFFIAAMLAGVAGALKAHSQRGWAQNLATGWRSRFSFWGCWSSAGWGQIWGRIWASSPSCCWRTRRDWRAVNSPTPSPRKRPGCSPPSAPSFSA